MAPTNGTWRNHEKSSQGIFSLGNQRHSFTFNEVIHPSAIIHPKAKLDSTVRVGPYAVIDEGVEIGADCIVGPHTYLTGNTIIGANNRFFAGSIIGEAPQDLKYDGEPTRLRIGDRNVFREHTTVHRSTKPEDETIVGSDNYFMAGAHIGHNCRVGNGVIMANAAMLGGHVSVDDRAFISGSCLVHQFVRVGTLTMMQGGSAISKDLPPYTMVRLYNRISGLNTVGLRRAGLRPEERLELRQLYHAVFRSGSKLSDALAAAQKQFSRPPSKVMLAFLTSPTHGGFCTDAGAGRGDQESDAE